LGASCRGLKGDRGKERTGLFMAAVCRVQVAPLDRSRWQGTTLRIVQNYRQSRGDDGNLILSFTSISEQS
jgi:hypothetical protein